VQTIGDDVARKVEQFMRIHGEHPMKTIPPEINYHLLKFHPLSLLPSYMTRSASSPPPELNPSEAGRFARKTDHETLAPLVCLIICPVARPAFSYLT
jgi:hypothetical protein